MPTFATQQINSGFGTYHPGDPLDEDVPPSVREAWLAAGLAEEVKPEKAAPRQAAAQPARPEKATKPKPEKAARVTTRPEPHRRFVENATAPAPERGTVGPEAD